MRHDTYELCFSIASSLVSLDLSVMLGSWQIYLHIGSVQHRAERRQLLHSHVTLTSVAIVEREGLI